MYVEDTLNGLHGEILSHLDHEEIDILFVSLQEVDGVVALHNQDLVVLAGEEFGIFAILDGRVFEFERSVEHAEDRGDLGPTDWDLHIPEDFFQSLLVFHLEGFHASVTEKFLGLVFVALGFLLEVIFDLIDALHVMGELIPFADLFVVLFLPFGQSLDHVQHTGETSAWNFLLVAVAEAEN